MSNQHGIRRDRERPADHPAMHADPEPRPGDVSIVHSATRISKCTVHALTRFLMVLRNSPVRLAISCKDSLSRKGHPPDFAHRFHAGHPAFFCSKIEQTQLNTWVRFRSAATTGRFRRFLELSLRVRRVA